MTSLDPKGLHAARAIFSAYDEPEESDEGLCEAIRAYVKATAPAPYFDEVDLDIAIYNATPSISMPKAIVIRKAVVAYLETATPPAPAADPRLDEGVPIPERVQFWRESYLANRDPATPPAPAERETIERLREALKLAMPYINAWDMPADDFNKVSRAMLPEGVSHDQQEPDDPSKSRDPVPDAGGKG